MLDFSAVNIPGFHLSGGQSSEESVTYNDAFTMIHYQYAGDGLEGFLSRGSSYPREFHLKLFRDMLRIRMVRRKSSGATTRTR